MDLKSKKMAFMLYKTFVGFDSLTLPTFLQATSLVALQTHFGHASQAEPITFTPANLMAYCD